MSTKLFISTALFCLFYACNSEDNANQKSDDATEVLTAASDLKKDPPDQNVVTPQPPEQKAPDETITVIQVNDIQSYNLLTGEIIFTGFTVQDIHDRRIAIQFGVENSYLMPFYLEEQLLFEAKCISPVSSIPYHDLTFTWFGEKFYLSDGYHRSNSKEWNQIRETNAQKRKAGWEKFIQYLENTGKLDDTDEPEVIKPADPDPVPQDSVLFAGD